MSKLFKKFNLIRWYEKYNALGTGEGLKNFVRVVYTLSLCSVAIIFVWYCGIINLNLKNGTIPPPGNQDIHFVTDAQPSAAPGADNVQSGETGGKEKTSPVKSAEDKADAKKSEPAGKTKQDEQKAQESNNASPGAIQKAAEKKNEEEYGEVKETIYIGAKKTAQVSLTFDDGLDYKSVKSALDILKEKNLKCTFFVIGKAIANNPEIWKRAIDEGHQICNHTNKHQLLADLSDDIVQEEITGWETAVRKYIGEDYLEKMKQEFAYIRLPGGSGNKSKRILSIAQKNGYSVVGWNVETFTSVIRPLRATHTVKDISERIENHVIKKSSNGAIILLHFNKYDIGNLDEMIDGIIDRGFKIKTVSEIMK